MLDTASFIFIGVVFYGIPKKPLHNILSSLPSKR